MKQLDEYTTLVPDNDLLDQEEALTKEEKERILQRILTKKEQSQARTVIPISRSLAKEPPTVPKRKHRNIRTILAAALAAVLLFTTLVGAADYFSIDIRLANYLDLQNGQRNASGSPVHIVKQSQGIQVEMLETIRSSKVLYILCQVTAPEGAKLNDTYAFGKRNIPLKKGGGFYMQPLQADHLKENQMLYLIQVDIFSKLAGKEIHISLQDFGHYTDSSQGELTNITKGPWEFNWTLSNKDNATTKPINKHTTIGNKRYWIKTVTITPLTIEFTMARTLTDLLNTFLHKSPQNIPNTEQTALTITLKDGTTLTEADLSSSSFGSRGISQEFHYQFQKAIDTTQIKEIKIGSLKIPIDK